MKFEHLYIHIPFCVGKCNYCDFISYPIAGREGELSAYIGLLERELALWRDQAHLGPWQSIYIGGGTPSLLPPEQLGEFLAPLLRGQEGQIAEITIEANPDSLSDQKLALWREAGINRLSLGAQSFDDGLLKAMGRPHRAAQTKEAVFQARQAGFDNLSLDLIYGLPGQTLAAWEHDLEQALLLKADHISLYGLGLSEDSPWGRELSAGRLCLPPADDNAAMLELALAFLPAQGYAQYEISNFARPGFQSRHNRAYWQRDNYLGLGAAAASCFGAKRWFSQRDLAAYAHSLNQGQLPLIEEENLSIEEVLGEAMFLGLRLNEGINLADFAARYGVRLERYYKKPLLKLEKSGLLEIADGYLRLTDRGIMLGNEVFMEFV